MRKGQPFFTLQQLFIRYFRTAKVHKYVMKCAHFPWSQESNITEWRVCSGRPTSCVYLEAYSPLPPPVMVRRHTLGRDLGSGETTGHWYWYYGPSYVLAIFYQWFLSVIGYVSTIIMYYVFSFVHWHIHRINKGEMYSNVLHAFSQWASDEV